MYNLPIMLDLVKLFKGSAPDKTAFEQAHAVFRIQGDRLKVDQLDLIGKAVGKKFCDHDRRRASRRKQSVARRMG